jgi:hypothetical protein
MRYGELKGCSIFFVALLVLAGFVCGEFSSAQAASDQANKFEEYRTAIKKAYGVDIKNFKDTVNGGRADRKDITKYDLQQLLMGIKVEQEHTKDKLLAIEISTDHLEEFPNYYTRLKQMEEDAGREKSENEKVKTGRK